LHRWLRQHYSVHVFCNNDGERLRFHEIWAEYGLESPTAEVQSPTPQVQGPKSKVQSQTAEVQSPKSKVQSPNPEVQSLGSELQRIFKDVGLWTHLGAISRGFLFDKGRLVV